MKGSKKKEGEKEKKKKKEKEKMKNMKKKEKKKFISFLLSPPRVEQETKMGTKNIFLI